MILLTSLPNELLLVVFGATPTIQTAVRLSCVNRRLRSIWLNNSDQIIAKNLQFEIPSYEDAIALAVDEARFSRSASSVTWLDNRRPPPHLLLPPLLRNAQLASSACALMKDFIHNMPRENYRHTLNFTPFPSSYYTIRRFVLARNNPQLHHILRLELEAAPTDALRTHDELCNFMCELMGEEEQTRQGLLKDEADMTIDDELYANAVKEEWKLASDTISVALHERLRQIL